MLYTYIYTTPTIPPSIMPLPSSATPPLPRTRFPPWCPVTNLKKHLQNSLPIFLPVVMESRYESFQHVRSTLHLAVCIQEGLSKSLNQNYHSLSQQLNECKDLQIVFESKIIVIISTDCKIKSRLT